MIELRRIHGVSQRETARQLGVSESVVENNTIRGLRAVLKALETDDGAAPRREPPKAALETAHG